MPFHLEDGIEFSTHIYFNLAGSLHARAFGGHDFLFGDTTSLDEIPSWCEKPLLIEAARTFAITEPGYDEYRRRLVFLPFNTGKIEYRFNMFLAVAIYVVDHKTRLGLVLCHKLVGLTRRQWRHNFSRER
jgi:hypothetical protein